MKCPWKRSLPTGVRPNDAPVADVALLLEGTYPYIRGGVSSWVHQMIRGLPELTFSIIFIGGSREHYAEMKYELPENVIHLETHYLMDSPSLMKRQMKRRRGRREDFRQLARFHDELREATTPPAGILEKLVDMLVQPDGIDLETFLTSELTWAQICQSYLRYSTEPSFVDYFWTIRTIHQPVFALANIARGAPDAHLYHSVSTGYAGYLGMMLNKLKKRPFVLTEHGIYTKERKIDLSQAEWIQETGTHLETSLQTNVSYIRRLWIRFFESIGRMTYATAFPITSLYEGNRLRQLEDGAERSKTRVIPNGIDLERFAPLRELRAPDPPPILGLIGRVVPIKDIKTFIRAMHTVTNHLPEAEGWIVGPEDEDAEYARECHDLVASLGLEDKVKFLGFQNVADILPQLGLMILTSISEALPLVVLEGYASGLPAVTTDVGSCRELIEGNQPEDRKLGPSGAVVSISNPQALAQRAVELLKNPEKWRRAQQAGIERVEKYYTLDLMLDTYRECYEEAKAAWLASASS